MVRKIECYFRCLSIKVPARLVEIIDEYVSKGYFFSRSEAIRCGINFIIEYVRSLEGKQPFAKTVPKIFVGEEQLRVIEVVSDGRARGES